MSEFADRLVRWQVEHGRQDLPWQRTREPYRVWLSEIMLQQTQVSVVIGYYARFLVRFADVRALAAATLDDVLPLWAGLGYYARARNLHACARAVVERHGGQFPRSAAALAQLPGIGRSTAAAIAAFCFDERAPILDGNVKRVLARHFGVQGYPGQAAVERQLWTFAADLLPRAPSMPAYTQALMDLGAMLCTTRKPRCADCPVRSTCSAFAQGRVHELPAPRPSKAVPVRRAWWLVARAGECVLLRQRGPEGLWGGLWVPPTFDSAQALTNAAQSLGGVPEWLAPRRHGFTHYTLDYTPVLLTLPAVPPAAHEPGEDWVPLSRLDQYALPAPVKRLLQHVAVRQDDLWAGAVRATPEGQC
ncbi:MAG: A/G-specific adenine glycosylase [Betaproteobacteria bacterium]